jgi:hypothetical protein
MKWHKNLYYSFPVQLLALHLRSNLLLLGLWVLMALFFSGALGRKLGLQYLFLDPEYLGQVNFLSFYFLGLAMGSFYMSWNLTAYLLSAHHFPFLATLARPFTKFVLNNLLLPLGFLIAYLAVGIHFMRYYGGLGPADITMNVLGVLAGILTLVALYALYFQVTNRDIFHYQPQTPAAPIVPGRRQVDVDYIKQDRARWKVSVYLNESLQPRLVRSVEHYDSSLLMQIFKQNHLNALILQLLSMLLLLSLGYLIDRPAFRIPAGASIFILVSLVVAIVGALTYWFNEWRAMVLLLALLALNYVTRFDYFNNYNRAYGMDYQAEPADYTLEKLQSICESDQIETDRAATIEILDNWRRRAGANQGDKPRMVVLCVSGGGLRSALWTTQVVQTADSLLQGQLLGSTVLITGASGGMLGMAYLREILLRQRSGQEAKLYSPTQLDVVSKDLLNSIAFTIVSNDLLLPWSAFEYQGFSYPKDRGYIFEQQLNENTGYLLDKPIGDYREAERQALIPMLFLTPSILNDARRMIISPQGVTYMMVPPIGQNNPNQVEVDAVDFGWMFEAQQAAQLRMLTALRMNATYPYVLPSVVLPSRPAIEVMDAGMLDNYGIVTAARFIQVFREWILENTSGVVLLQISSSPKAEAITPSQGQGMVESLFNPLGIAGKMMAIQEFQQDNSLGFLFDLLGEEHFSLVRFFYRPSEDNKLAASISFHITEREKEDVLKAIELEENQASLRRLQQLMPAYAQGRPTRSLYLED